MNKFIESDAYGRKLLKELIEQFNATNIEETEDEYYPTDLYFNLKDISIVAEIKVRDIQYESYDTHLMEVNKYLALVKDKADCNKDLAIYVCFFGDDICYWYKSSDIKKYATRQTKRCNRTTAIYTGKKEKDCLMIPKNRGKKFIKVNGVWSKSEN